MRTHAVTTVDSLLDRLEIPNADLVGHSMGAQFSLYAAHDLGSRVGRIVLLGAPGAAFAGVKPVPFMKIVALPGLGRALLLAPIPDRAYRTNQDLVFGVGAFDGTPPQMAEAIRLLAGRRANAASIASFFRSLLRGGRVRDGVNLAPADLARIHQRALFAWGDQDVFMTPAQAASSLVAITDVRLLHLPTAGHAPWLQAPAVVGSAIAAHLAA
jgi:pimeloyl-ACP methyl ester carboxylesterase